MVGQGKIKYKFYKDFTAGMNDTAPHDSLKDNEVKEARNVWLHENGGFERRNGCTAVNDTSYADEVEKLMEIILSDGTILLFCIINLKLYIVDENDGSLTEIGTLNMNNPGYCFFQDKMYIVDGDKFWVFGEYDYDTSDGTVTIATDDIVLNYPASSGGGTANYFYKAKSALGSTNLATENYANTTNWEEVTQVAGIIPNVLQEVEPNVAAGVDLDPIKRCDKIIWHPASYRFFASGDSENQAALYYSEASDATNFQATSIMYPIMSMGPMVTLFNILEAVVCGYRYGWMVWNGVDTTTDVYWKRIPIPVGPISNDVVDLTPSSVTFESNDGVWTINPAIMTDYNSVISSGNEVYNLSGKKIENIIGGMNSEVTLNKSCYYQDKYFLAYRSGGAGSRNNYVVVMDWQKRAWVKIEGWQVNCWLVRRNGDLLFGSKNYILKAFEGLTDIDVDTGNAKAISSYVETKPYDLDAFAMKLAKYFYISMAETTAQMTVTVYSGYAWEQFTLNVDTSSFEWGGTWGGSWGTTDIIDRIAALKLEGTRFKVVFEDSTINTSLAVGMFGFDYEILNTRKFTEV